MVALAPDTCWKPKIRLCCKNSQRNTMGGGSLSCGAEAATPNRRAMKMTCLAMSPLFTFCTCLFRIIFITSYPCNVRPAV
jgi:hypothetical protein